jgi:hypothetical protein
MMRGEIAGPVWQQAMMEANRVTAHQNRGANLFDLSRRQANKVSSSRSYEGSELWALKRHMDRVGRFDSATTLLEEGQSRYAAEGDLFASGNASINSNASILDQDAAAWGRLTAAVSANATALTEEMALEQQKAKIATGEATAVNASADAYNTMAGATKQAGDTLAKHNAQFATLSSDHKYLVDGKDAGVNATNTGIISALTGKA